MGSLRRVFLRVLNVLRPERAEPDLAREITSHLSLLEDEFRRRGLSAEDARVAARRAFGGVDRTKDLHRDARSFMWLDDARRDIHYAFRTLRNSPVFAATAVMTLALGVGVNTAVFSAVDAVVLRRLPYADPGRLVMVWEDATAAGFPRNTPAPGNYSDWARLNRVFTGMAASASASANVTGGGEPEQVLGRRVTGNFFDVLGVHALLGRGFTADDDRSGAPVVILSYDLWQRRYNGDPSIVGKTVVMNDRRHDVIGVMPRSFVFRRNDIEFWIPIHFAPDEAASRRSHYLHVVARLKPGVGIDAANADMRRVSMLLQQEYPETNGNAHVTTSVLPLKSDLLGDSELELLVLMGAAAAVLLIASANLATLLLSRAIGRRGELALRVALGATRARLLRQMLMEALVVATVGGLLALAIAPAGISLLAQLVPDGFPPAPASVLNGPLLLFTFAVAMFAGCIFSIVPAWQATRASGRQDSASGGRVVGHDTRRTRDTLVVLQLAAAFALLFVAGLMLRTVANVRSIDVGFRPDHLLTLRTALPQARYAQPAQRLRFDDQVLSGVEALPGVEDAAYASTLPFTSIGNTTWYQIEGVALAPDDPADALWRVGTFDYLKTLGVTLLEGRLLDRRDTAGAPLAIVINETTARKYWPHRSPIGHRLRFRPEGPWYTVAGVIRDIRERGYILGMKPAVYFTAAQFPAPADSLVARVAGDPLNCANAIRRVVGGVDAEQPLAAVRTMDDILDGDVRDRQEQMFLLTAFAGLALVLAVIGLYGVVSYSVAQRSREFGVRMALGATASSVIRGVLARALSLTALGLACGVSLAWIGARGMTSLLYGVSSTDSMTFAAAIALFSVTAILGSYLPARRATRVDPALALRSE